MSITVLSVAYPFAPVGPDCVGGAEQILSDLDLALVAAGHHSLVLACEGSSTGGKLVPFPRRDTDLDNQEEQHRLRAELQAALDLTLQTQQVDLIHMHGFDFYEYRLPTDIPVLVTLHLPVAWYPSKIWNNLQTNLHFQCVSKIQQLSSAAALSKARVIPNGVDACSTTKRSNDFAVVLGRICPEKNQHAALQAGFLAKLPIVLGGHVFPFREHKRYFFEKITPLLRQTHESVRHTFCGPVPHTKRQQLLTQAKCLLHPTLAPETSSLVAMEAMAAGTPVIAYKSGALPEIVEDGTTGFLVDGVDEMAAAIHRAHTIHPDDCRAAAAQRFSKQRMVEQYFQLYQEIIHSPGQRRPHA